MSSIEPIVYSRLSRSSLSPTHMRAAVQYVKMRNHLQMPEYQKQILDEALVVGVHLTNMEAKYGWPARSAKAIIGVLLTSMYLPEHLPSVVPPVADETAQEDQVATIMRTLLVHRRVAVLLRVLMERTDRAVSYEALIEEIWLNDPNGAPLSAPGS